MPQFTIPTKDSKKWIQPNKGDIFGNLWATFNMDFDVSQGKARVSPMLRINTDSVDDTDLGVPTAFLRANVGTDRYWALCGTRLFRTSSTNPTAAFTEAATDDGGTTAPPTTMTEISSDMVVFNGKLYVSLPTDIAELDATVWDNDWWTTIVVGTALTTGIPHPLCVSLKTNSFMVGDGNLLHITNKTENPKNSRVILPTEFEIIWIRSTSDGTWIGARHKTGGEGKVFFWDESAENYNRGYGVMSRLPLSCVIKDGIPYTITTDGQLLKFTGLGFEEVAVLPCFKQINKNWDSGSDINLPVVHRNGMALIENKIHININAYLNQGLVNLMENFPSGIWTFDETQGLRHKYSLSQYDGTEIDYGSFLNPAGALLATNLSQGSFLVGGRIYTNQSDSLYAILYRNTDDSVNKRGHFITSVFESSSFEDIFKDILLSFKRFRNSGDRIIIKYRNIKNLNYPIQGNGSWSSTTVFTVTGSGNPGSFANITASDEVMIIRGRGAGATAKISSVSESGGTYTITLAEAIPNVSGSMVFVVGDWTEAATISTQSIERQSFDLDVVGTFIQLKVELRSAPSGTAGAGDSPELEKIIINSDKEILV